MHTRGLLAMGKTGVLLPKPASSHPNLPVLVFTVTEELGKPKGLIRAILDPGAHESTQ